MSSHEMKHINTNCQNSMFSIFGFNTDFFDYKYLK